mmetsp:Transcript_13543/g.20638  ORF Transcript_13543/g.20638 Transcript_13543/m.20638 type:complete len:338 (+) Transcript_13543:108-1121(+)
MLSNTHLVIPGQVITESSEGGGFLRGHGTYVENIGGGSAAGENRGKHENSIEMMDAEMQRGDGSDADEDMPTKEKTQQQQRLIASVAGVIERVNKLVSVSPAASSVYVPAIGDLVVGRISTVQANRWKVTLNPTQREAALLLSGVNLPNGAQRIRTSEDALMMRKLYTEGDLVSAEVQQVMHDGTASLHTRSLRYGKLENGCVVTVPPSLVPRMKQHFATLTLSNASIDVLLACNGILWIQRSIPKEWTTAEDQDIPLAETLQKQRKRHAETPVLSHERTAICRVRNSIEALRVVNCRITPDTITAVYECSLDHGIHPKMMMDPRIVIQITAPTRKR